MLNVFDAIARMTGSLEYPDIHGTVKFLEVSEGTWVEAEIFGLPDFSEKTESSPQTGPFAFHIHENGTCGALAGDNPFMAAGGHWNPDDQPHGNHAGDFPILLSNGGTAKMLFFTDRFTPDEVIGKSVVIHLSPDDYTTQPAMGGKRIACGQIVSVTDTM